MSTQAYRTWNAAGRPYRVAEPIAKTVYYARTMGIPVLGVLGNDAHLLADPPEDHTPYPAKPWPGKLDGYVVTACDLKNGPHAGVLLEKAKSGQAPWVKYLNFGGEHYDIRNDWEPTHSSDEHLHVSTRSDYTYTQLTENPLIGGNDVELSSKFTEPLYFGDEEIAGPVLTMTVSQALAGARQDAWYARRIAEDLRTEVRALTKLLAKIVDESGSVESASLADLRIVRKTG